MTGTRRRRPQEQDDDGEDDDGDDDDCNRTDYDNDFVPVRHFEATLTPIVPTESTHKHIYVHSLHRASRSTER